ncbi:hypothetical protein C8R45DRAFT_1209200 [Mycena sanguinolenta]|nr:hypothetical protein C8R45DRAFT_1209200 [Mycena sanguinolenta]
MSADSPLSRTTTYKTVIRFMPNFMELIQDRLRSHPFVRSRCRRGLLWDAEPLKLDSEDQRRRARSVPHDGKPFVNTQEDTTKFSLGLSGSQARQTATVFVLYAHGSSARPGSGDVLCDKPFCGTAPISPFAPSLTWRRPSYFLVGSTYDAHVLSELENLHHRLGRAATQKRSPRPTYFTPTFSRPRPFSVGPRASFLLGASAHDGTAAQRYTFTR